MSCDFNNYSRDCEEKYQDCLSKVNKIEKDCNDKVEKLKKDCAKKMLQQAGIWGTIGGVAAGIGVALSGPIGWAAALAIVGGSGAVGAAAGAASKGLDCSEEVTKAKEDCETKIKQAKEDCEKERECCEKWNSLMFELGHDYDCKEAWDKGFQQLKLAGCAGMWADFKDLWERCCKK